MAVGYSSAPEEEWLFVSGKIENIAMNRKAVDWNATGLDFSLTGDMELDLVGVLMGDVNGSWIGVQP
jgi:hypothetical protein